MVSQAIPSYSFWQEGPAFQQFLERKRMIAEIVQEYFPVKPWMVFPNTVFYLDLAPIVRISPTFHIPDCDYWSSTIPFDMEQVTFVWQFLACEIRAYGGIIVDCISKETTHIIVADKSRGKMLKMLNGKFGGLKRIVHQSWVSKSIANKGMLDEASFAC